MYAGKKKYNDWWIVKLTPYGEIEWQKILGGSGEDEANSIQQTSDHGFIIAGTSGSLDGDVTNCKCSEGYSDFWIVKLSPDGNYLQEDISDSVFSVIAPEPTLKNLFVDMKQVLVGVNRDSTVTAIICNTSKGKLFCFRQFKFGNCVWKK